MGTGLVVGQSFEVDGTLERLRTLLAKTKKDKTEVASLLSKNPAKQTESMAHTPCQELSSLAANFFQSADVTTKKHTDTVRLNRVNFALRLPYDG